MVKNGAQAQSLEEGRCNSKRMEALKINVSIDYRQRLRRLRLNGSLTACAVMPGSRLTLTALLPTWVEVHLCSRYRTILCINVHNELDTSALKIR